MEDKLRVLVITGSWNSPLFSVKWINENLFDSLLPERIDMEYTVSYDEICTKTFKIGRIDIEVSQKRLCFLANQDDNESLAQIIDLANKVATLLPHTPYEYMGLNLRYIKENTPILNVAFPMISGYKTENQSVSLSFNKLENSNQTINLVIHKTMADNQNEQTIYEFNFHHIIKDSGEVKEYLTYDAFEKVKEESLKIIEEIENA